MLDNRADPVPAHRYACALLGWQPARQGTRACDQPSTSWPLGAQHAKTFVSGASASIGRAMLLRLTRTLIHSAFYPTSAAAAVQEWAEQAPVTARLPQNDVELNVWRPRSLRATVPASGVRRAVVLLAGSEHRFWAGEYGCKFAAPVLHFEVQGLRPSAGSGQS